MIFVSSPRAPRCWPARLAGWTAWIVVAIAAAPATGQSLAAGRSLANAADSDAVQQRPRPLYDASGIGLGSFRVSPVVAIGLGYDDNIFNSQRVRVSDGIVIVRPSVTATSQWSRHSLSFDANASIERYLDTGIANADQYGASVSGRYDISRALTFGFSGRRARAVEPRGTLGDVGIGGEPTRYDETAVSVTGSATLAKAIITVNAGVSDLDYKSIQIGDTILSQDFRDRKRAEVGMRAAFALGPGIRLFASGSYNEMRFLRQFGSVNQDSEGYNVLGGVSFGLTDLISGEVGLGYISQHFREDAFGTIRGLNYRGRLTWNPTRLTTVTLRGDRTIQPSPFFGQSGVSQGQFGVAADHELLRNLILTAAADLVRERYEDLDRSDKRQMLSLAARMLFNRHMEAALRVNHRWQTSTGLQGRRYNGSGILLALMFKR